MVNSHHMLNTSCRLDYHSFRSSRVHFQPVCVEGGDCLCRVEVKCFEGKTHKFEIDYEYGDEVTPNFTELTIILNQTFLVKYNKYTGDMWTWDKTVTHFFQWQILSLFCLFKWDPNGPPVPQNSEGPPIGPMRSHMIPQRTLACTCWFRSPARSLVDSLT